MRKFTKTLCAVLCLICGTCLAAACTETSGEQTHKHTYETDWTRTETEHYKKSTCEHKDEKGELGYHEYGTGENKNKCTVCGYVQAAFDGVTESAPVEDIFTLSARSNSKQATSVWQTVYGDSSLDITVWVKDEIVVSGEKSSNSDGVRIWLSEVSSSSGYVAGKTLSIFVGADGRTELLRANEEGKLTACGAETVTVSAKEWAESGETVVGYKITVSVLYEAVGIAAEDAKGNISIAAELYNTSSVSFKATVRAYSLTSFGVDVNNQNTYLVIEDDNRYALNSEPYPTGTFNYKQDIYSSVQSHWDISKDYLFSDANYAEREVSLNNTLGTGKYNELYFYKSQGTLFYCESDFTLPSNPVFLDDPLPKYGICLVNEANNGIYFYFAADASGTTVTRISNVGYTFVRNGVFKWENSSSAPASVHPSETAKLAMFRDGAVIKLLFNGEVIFTLDGNSGISNEDEAIPAVFSFNIALKLTNYRLTNDSQDEVIKQLSQKLPAYAGEFKAAYDTFDSSNYQLNLSEMGKLDWAYYGGMTSPTDLKSGASKRYIGEAVAVNKDALKIDDILYENSSLIWTDGSNKKSNTLTGNIAGLKFDGTGAQLLQKLNVYAGEQVTYYLWFGGYEASTFVKVYDAHGNVLHSDKVGGENGRTLGRLDLTVASEADTQITLEFTVDSASEKPFPQLWMLAAAAIKTSEIPSDASEAAVKGNVEAKINGRLRNEENIDLTAYGTKDWAHYTKEEGKAVSVSVKAGENGYFGKLISKSGINGMGDYLLGSGVKLSWTDGAAPNSSKTYTDQVPAVTVLGSSGAPQSLTQELYVKANEPVRFMLWAAAWLGGDVNVKLYDSEKVWYTGAINATKHALIDITVSSETDACLKAELSSEDQVWYLGGAAAEPSAQTAPSQAQFNGTVQSKFLVDSRASVQIDIANAMDWIYFPVYDPVLGYEGALSGQHFGDLVFEGKAAYPFSDFATDNSTFAYSGGKINNTKTYKGNIPGLSLYGNGSNMTLALNVTGTQDFSYFIWCGSFKAVLTLDVKTASGVSVLEEPLSVGTDSGATVGCLRLDLSNVNESVLYVEMTCTGQEIWLCAAKTDETPVDPDVAFEGNLKTDVGTSERSNTSIDLTAVGTYDWVVLGTDAANPERKNIQKPVIGNVEVKMPQYTSGSMTDFFYQNSGVISWSDGTSQANYSSQPGADFPALTSTMGYRIPYSIPAGFDGTIYIWIGYWGTVADVRITDIEGNLLDMFRIGDSNLGKLYCLKINVSSVQKTKLYVDIDTMEQGHNHRTIWLFGTAVGEYEGNTHAQSFNGSAVFESHSFNRENYSLNLTEKGSLDWVVYNNGSITDFESKNTHAQSPYIGPLALGAYTEISKEENYFYNNIGVISWNDGTKEAEFASTANSSFPGIQAGFKSASFILTLKAEAGKSIKYSVYTGGWSGQVAAILSDENGVISISRAYGSMDGVDTLCIDVTVTSTVDTDVYLRVYKFTTDYSYNALTVGANLMLMGVTAGYADADSFGGNVSAELSELDRFNSTIDVTSAGSDDWRVYNKGNVYDYNSKADVSYGYIGELSFEGRFAGSFADFLYQNQGVVSWTDGKDGAYTSSAGDNIGGLTTRDTFVLKLNVKANTNVRFTVWLGGYNNSGTSYVIMGADGRQLSTGTFGNAGTGYVGSLVIDAEGGAEDSVLTLKIVTNNQESWIFGAAASEKA